MLGIVALLIGATGAFTQPQTSLNRVWHMKPDPQAGGVRSLIGQRIVSLGTILAIGFVVSLAIITALFAAIFKVLPDAAIHWRDVWIGAGITAVFFTIGKHLIGMYLGHSAIASTYGAARSFVLLLVWIYYSSMILLFGAEFTAIRTGKTLWVGSAEPGAVRVSREVKLHPKHAAY